MTDWNEVVDECAITLLRQHRLRNPGVHFGPSSEPDLTMDDARSLARAMIGELGRIRQYRGIDPLPSPELLVIPQGTGSTDVVLEASTALVPLVKALRSVTGITLAQAVRICRLPLPAVVIHGAATGEAATARLMMETVGATISLRASSRTAGPGMQDGPLPEF
jgi:hypothetical protein